MKPQDYKEKITTKARNKEGTKRNQETFAFSWTFVSSWLKAY